MAKDSFALKHLGDEPIFKEEATAIEIAKVYNWYNYFFTGETSLQYTLDYLKYIKSDKEYVKKVSKLPHTGFPTFIGWIYRQIMIGSKIPTVFKDKAEATLNTFLEKNTIIETDENKPTVNIQERIKAKTSNIIGDLEVEIDNCFSNTSHSFDCYQYLLKNNVKPHSTKDIVTYYTPLKEELEIALKKSDPQVKEAYSYLSAKELKAALSFVEKLISDANRFTTNTKSAKKPRAKKAAPLAKQVEKLSYKTEDKGLKLVSVNPTTIIAANQLWVYNTKTRFLGLYIAAGHKGLAVKGTSIIGFDEKTSIQKRLRKPEEALKIVLTGSKVELRKLLPTITTKELFLNGRISKDIILLKVIKNG